MVPHPPYSPDLAPSDYYLFPHLKKSLGGMRLSGNDEMMSFVKSFFEDMTKSQFSEGMKALERRLHKCISLAEDYVEKKRTLIFLKSRI